MENWAEESPVLSSTKRNFIANSVPLESICEDRVVVDRQNQFNFVPVLRSGEWSDIGTRPYMEDTHVCISDLAEKFGHNLLNKEAISFYGVSSLIYCVFQQTVIPLIQSFLSISWLLIWLGAENLFVTRSLLVANAGDCRAVLSRCGRAVELSRDHRPCCKKERMRVESLGGYVDDGYLNGQLGVTRALGDWHIEGMKEMGDKGPLSAEPELKLITLTKDDEFLIIGSDGIWDVFSNQNAVDFARRRLQDHNDVKLCCKQIVEEAMTRGATDNLTVVLVSFHLEPPPPVVVEKRTRVRRSISAEGLHNIKCLLE
ncbi:Protein phosphatase [Trema orientale]|uniref:Protein phosphatase n=1 Tax=Trema orientale TaxID=63057 RepID=A0A2P5BXL5_TREOI|nr:Protein phosphatase [Trema orientale]